MKEIYEEALFFDYVDLLKKEGKAAMNESVVEYVKRENPDLIVIPLFLEDEFEDETLEELRRHSKTLCYFWDDIWRTAFADRWAPHFDYFTTASRARLLHYKDLGYSNCLYSPHGYNHTLFKRKGLQKKYDVTFVGGSHPYRKWLIDQLEKAGINVMAWGGGIWPAGRLTPDQMVDVFNQSKINLNISNSRSMHLPYLLSSWRAMRAITSPKNKEQLKARMFEINGAGGFQLTYYAEGLEHCYDIGKEIAVYMDIDDLSQKIRYYLKHEDEREAIADAGYRRALREHTFAQRFVEIADWIFGKHSRAGGMSSA
jgi:spore maturation protein CgeB